MVGMMNVAATMCDGGMGTWLRAAPRRMVAVSGNDEWLTGVEVKIMLGVDRSTVHRIPSDSLPYTATEGGPLRGGKRRYRLADVERYIASRTTADERLAAVEARVAELERWRSEQENAGN